MLSARYHDARRGVELRPPVMLPDYWYAFQQEQFPRMEGKLGLMAEHHDLFVTPNLNSDAGFEVGRIG